MGEHHVTTSTYNTVHEVPEQHVATHDVVTAHAIAEQHVTTSEYTTTHEVPEQHVATHDVVTTHTVATQHVATHDVVTAHAIPEHHVTTSEYTTAHEVPEHHVTTSEYTTVHEVPEHHVATSTYNTVHQVPEQHVALSHYNTVHQVPEQHVALSHYKTAHTYTTPYTVSSTAYKAQSYKVPYSVTHTKTVALPSSGGYRRLAETGARTMSNDAGAQKALASDKMGTDDATSALKDTLSKLPYGAKVVATHTDEYKAYKTYTVVSHLVCTPKVTVSYQCPACTGSNSYVPSYGADFMGDASEAHKYSTIVMHHVYHPKGVTEANADGALQWTETKDGWKAEGKDWQSASLNQAAAVETTTSHKSAAGTVIGATVGCVVGLTLVALAVYKRRSATSQPAAEDNMSIL